MKKHWNRSVNTNIGNVQIHLINKEPIIGTNMITDREILIIETENKKYCCMLTNKQYDAYYHKIKINYSNNRKYNNDVDNIAKYDIEQFPTSETINERLMLQ